MDLSVETMDQPSIDQKLKDLRAGEYDDHTVVMEVEEGPARDISNILEKLLRPQAYSGTSGNKV